MAKSVSVVIPAMLLVVDWFPGNRLRQGAVLALLAEKIPFFLLSLLMSIVTIHFTGQSEYLVTYDVFPLWQRILVSGNAIFEYCRLFVFPLRHNSPACHSRSYTGIFYH